MSKKRSIGKIVKFLIFGLELPAFVLLGLYLGFLVEKGLGRSWSGAFVLSGALIGLVLGSMILWWTALRLYKRSKRSVTSPSHTV
ncbi:MAG: hypothetical protein H3Z53_09175 [archaeon]|nr:hypothetical protein [archaeon]MCP8314525.1 hypothetical protein [archaeon]MCP8317299.1 hypothetical protein [archaeon]MCP8321403.1 hypothetical protein [archaeon]